jgi:aminopeptidase N
MKRTLALLAFALTTFSMAVAQRLPEIAVPENYKLTFTPDLEKATFEGDETISVRVLKPTSEITLNAADIDFHDVTVTSAGSAQTAAVTPEKDKEMVVLAVERPLSAGPATIHITYTGILNGEMRGLYLGKDDQGRKYAASQFEATDARRAFPSFDEPAYKATFDITAVADKGQVAISNQKVASDTPGPGDKHTVRFATTAKMSSYLAALVVGNFEYLEGEADGIPIRIYGTPGTKEMGAFALETTEHVLSYFDKYFNIKYPYGKLDLVALPDFSAGAMENVGCITFREVLLQIDEKHASPSLKKNIASIISHEVAHMWFGDMVTMKWWDDIWLNEGFATWMANKPLEAWKPEWNFDVDDVSGTGGTLNTDSLATTRPIQQAAETPAQISELFDGIAYGKAGSVLRMLEAYLGEQTFRAGVNAYLKQHQYANATADDFWVTQAKTSKKPVDQIMPTFVKQAGVPIINLKSQCSGNSTTVTLDQRRYYVDREKFQSPNDQLWQVPMCLKSSTGAQRCELLTKRQETFTLPGCSTWVLANAGATGYYRDGYQPDAVRALASDAESKLSPGERIVLQADIWSSVRVGGEPVGDYLAFAQGLGNERNRAVLDDVLARLNYIRQYLVTDGDGEAFRGWLRQYLTPILKNVGLESKPGESDEQRTLRGHLFSALGYDARDPEVQAQARKIADQVLNDPASVDRELATAALAVAALNGDEAFYARLMTALKNAKSPEEYYMYFSTLPQFGDPKLLGRTLDFALSPDVRSQDALQLVTGVMFNASDGGKMAWDFVLTHWDAVQKAGGPFASAQVVGATSSFCDAHMRDQVVDFYAAHKVEGAERTYRQSIERINNCVDLKSQQEPQLASWLGQHVSSAGEQ